MDDETLGAWRALLNVHGRVVGEVEDALAAAGLPPLAWYDALWPLRRAKGRRLRMGALAQEVTLSRTGLSRLVDRLESNGLLRREAAPEDRRGSYVVLTRSGGDLVRRMWPVYERALTQSFAPEPGDAATVRRILEHVSAPTRPGHD